MAYDLYQPLGFADRPARRMRRPGRLLRPTAFGLLGLALLAGSLATALREPDYAEVAGLPQPIDTPAPDVPAAPATPTIVRGDETAGVNIVQVNPFAVDPGYTGSIRVLEPGSLRQPERLAHLPERDLIETSAFGDLPTRAGDGRRPLDVYAGAAGSGGGTRVAIVVGGLGISQSGTQAALRVLPPATTLAFAASGNSLDRWMQEARRGGHELLLQAPMEPFGYPNVSPGPGTLTAEDAAAGRLDDLLASLGAMTNYVGVMNFMGARLTADPAALEPVLAEIERRGLLYLDDGSSGRSAARDVALASAVPFARAERVLDQIREPEAIRAELDVLERSARATGSAIGVASAFDVSIAAIAEWAAEAATRGIELVPVSAIAYDPQAR